MLSKILYRTGALTVDLCARLMFNRDIVRHAPLPEGAKIISPNHPSTTDPFLILASFQEPVSILIDNRLFKVPLFGEYLRRTGHIPVVEGQGYTAFEAARRLLEEGRTVVVFPEGTISPLAGGLHPPRTGAARLALLTGAPIIPVGIYLERRRLRLIETRIDGKKEIGTWYLGGPFAVTFGQPMWFQGDVENREYVASMSKRLMRRIAQLTFESAYRVIGMQALAALDSGELVIL